MSNEHITDERAAFVSWSQREYRHATIYTNRDFEIGLAAWEARAALRPAAQPAEQWETSPKDGEQWETSPMAAAQPVGEPVAWECFRDITYFDMWAVRPIGCNTFKDTFHVISQKEAQVLCDVLMGKIAPMKPVAVPDRVPMTDEQILQGQNDRGAVSLLSFMKGVRHAEAHHGITTPKADK